MDRQLEESTRDFDGIIYDEEQRQREADRARDDSRPASRRAQNEWSRARKAPSAAALPALAAVQWAADWREPRKRAADGWRQVPTAGDIPAGNDDDVVARQLREAAMREADPEVREKLWNEYRKYKGIEVPAHDTKRD